MPAVYLLIPRGNGSMSSRLPTSSMQAPRSGYTARCAAISMPRRSSRWWPSFSASMACLACSRVLNDPRLVGSPSGRDFPSALVRFLWCVGVVPNVIPPHRPDLNAYVERFHRSLAQECLQVHRPGTLSQVSELTEAFLSHYNSERPNQARSCGNQPPRVACQQFPTLPRVPEMVDPDRWLVQMQKHAFARMIRASGHLTINRE